MAYLILNICVCVYSFLLQVLFKIVANYKEILIQTAAIYCPCVQVSMEIWSIVSVLLTHAYTLAEYKDLLINM